jgi:hypothetical protein
LNSISIFYSSELFFSFINKVYAFFKTISCPFKFVLISINPFVVTPNSTATNLERYILKPLFSFAGKGVIIDIQSSDFVSITDPENWILQEKVNYAPCIETPYGFAKAEIRVFYFWDRPTQKYIATLNLCRLSKGKMIGVNYNQTATWVGGSLAYFEK